MKIHHLTIALIALIIGVIAGYNLASVQNDEPRIIMIDNPTAKPYRRALPTEF